jgi:GAF domain-containing protein
LPIRVDLPARDRRRTIVVGLAPPDARTDEALERRLAGLSALTDAALTILDLDELLNEMLDRVLAAVAADTAAVLLVDESGSELVARASRGIEEEVRQGVRIPIGAGFAGSIAADQRARIIDHVDDSTVWNPILWKVGIHTMLGVPLVVGDQTIGVLHVGRLGRQPFEQHDVQLVQVAGDRIASAVRLRLLESERSAAEALQRGLMPSLPSRRGVLELAARYVPAEHGGIGGDWFDVFETPDNTVWIVTGDVAGHGLRAAIVMGRIRSALRSYALVSESPSAVLSLTHRKIDHFEVGHMATVVVAVLRPPFDELLVASAGHPPPVIARPDEAASFVPVDAGPPLGAALGDQSWPATPVPFGPGAVAVLYSDGLIERRHEDLTLGLERLRESVQASPPRTICQSVMAAMIGDYAPDDDVALLAVRRVDDSA